jgi:hypothetical protein
MCVRGGLLKRSSAASSIVFLTSLTGIDVSSSILAIGAGNALSLAALTDFL